MVDPLSYLLFQQVSTTGVTGHGVYYHVCGMVQMKHPIHDTANHMPSFTELSFTMSDTIIVNKMC